MSEPFIGEIRIFAGNLAPRGWAFCDGQLLAISQNDALFSLFGTIYGGDGRTTFALPDLRGRIPLHAGTGPGLTARPIGSRGGVELVALTMPQLPAHTHQARAIADAADSQNPQGRLFARAAEPVYGPADSELAPMPAGTVGNTGGNAAHSNLQPFLCIYFIVALTGIYPSRN